MFNHGPSLLHTRVGPTMALLLGVVLALLALPAMGAPQPEPTPPAEQEWYSVGTEQTSDMAAGDMENLVQQEGEIRLGDEESFIPRESPPFDSFGLYTSPVLDAETPFDEVRLLFDGDEGEHGSLSLEIRVQTWDGKWTPWHELEVSGQALAPVIPGKAVQYRATLMAETGLGHPALRSVTIEARKADRGSSAVQYQSLATRPTVRLYATRQGMVGGITSNGHKIVDRDRFVALPSKVALNSRDKRDYQVEVTYKGRTTTAPVWDVGPWNTKDNFWDASREIFGDLPRFTPQVNAAFFNNHNNGQDQYGRLVLYPAAIDLADGTFWDDLGMKGSDWVDVTFTWVDAAAPPLVAMPVVIPKPGPIPQQIKTQGTTQSAAPQPPVAPVQAAAQQPAATAVPPTPVPPPPTPTPTPKAWYFAEGNTNKPFDTWLLLQNPDPVPANAKITFMLPNGGQKIASYGLKPSSRTSVYVNQIVPDTEVASMVEYDNNVLAERAMYFGSDGHDTVGASNPSTKWYFAEGNTTAGFETWVLLQNPNTVPANVNLTFYRENGDPVTQSMLVPHVSRASLLVNQVVSDASLGIKVESDRPIVAERSVYKNDEGKAGSDSIGATDLSKVWYMAEGNSRDGYDTWLLMMNPGDQPANVSATYMREDGTTASKQYMVPPRARASIYVNDEVPNCRMGIKLESDTAIVAERSFYFGGGAGSHTTVAAPAPAKRWYMPEGSTNAPFTENVHVMNPNSVPANVTVSLMKEDGTSVDKSYAMKPTSRLTLYMNDILPDTNFSTRVESDQPVVAERSMYFNDWKGGTNSMGIPR